MQGERNSKTEKRSLFRLDIAEPKLILYKDNANERNESVLSNSRVQLIKTEKRSLFRLDIAEPKLILYKEMKRTSKRPYYTVNPY